MLLWLHDRNSELDKTEAEAVRVHNREALDYQKRVARAMSIFKQAPSRNRNADFPFDYMSPRQKRRFAAKVAENNRSYRVGMKNPPPPAPPAPLPQITICSSSIGDAIFRRALDREEARFRMVGPNFVGVVDQSPRAMMPVGALEHPTRISGHDGWLAPRAL
eukprot:SAG31_NODE_675_length_12908_cov_11.596612_3_plen_162_part_00